MVSIILCTYNRASLLPRAISSVLKQTYNDWELVVVDDGSSDNTRATIRSLQKTEPRIVYWYQKNQGLAKARNSGLRLAKGKFICFLDSDDEFAPRHLETRIKCLAANRKIDFIHGGAMLIGPRAKRYVVDLTDPSKKIHLSRCHIGGTFFFRRKVLRKVRSFRAIPFGEDFDFYSRVERSFAVRKVRAATYLYHLETEDRLCDVFTKKLLGTA